MKATLFFTDGETKDLLLDEAWWLKKHELKIFNNATIIPFETVASMKMNNSIYERKKVKIYSVEQMQEFRSLKTESKDTVLLLEKISGGSINLFHHLDKRDTKHWFVEKGNIIEELLQIWFVRDNKAGSQDRYKGLLGLLMNDCPQIKRKEIENLHFDLKSIRQLVQKYNEACGSVKYAAPAKKRRVSFGLIAGYQIHRSQFGEPNLSYDDSYLKLADMKKLEASGVKAGIFFRYPIIKRHDKFAMVMSAYYSPKLGFNYRSTIFRQNFSDTVTTASDFSASFFNAALSFQYIFPLKKKGLASFIEAGAGFKNLINISENKETVITARRPFWLNEITRKALNEPIWPYHLLIYQASAGMNVQKFQFAVSLAWGKGGISADKSESHYLLGLDVKYRL
ncbi:MAG: hypothetical protein HY842_03785 [Bacteroidetes bacterium]|nr:hypothetical protein [Bacteroidota bacterium]